MNQNLKGLLSTAGSACEKGDRTYGAMYAFTLMELGDHIRGLVRGDHTPEEFAKHYCIDPEDKEPWADQGPEEDR